MAGLPGSGKSTLARGLAAEIGGAVLDKDVVRAALFAPADIEHSTQQNDFCVGIMLRVAAYLWKVKPQRVVLLDGRTFSRRSQRDEVAAFAAQHGRPFRLIACVCSDETARRRLEAGAPSHLAGDRDFGLYQTIKRRFEPIDEPHLLVDTDDTYQACLDRCLAYIRGEGAQAG